ncbi:MAG: glutamate--tRNA ligase [Balneolaceae bacterium]
MKGTVRVRFAPSPTGFLHIGGLRTALYNYLFAKSSKAGAFILRIEDTDQARYMEGAEEDITNALAWCGLHVDEGPANPGDHGPYRQSERKDIYCDYAEQLVESGHAYYAFDSAEELDGMRERLQKSGNPSPKYDSITRQSMKNSLTLSGDEVKSRLDAGEPHVIRLKVPRRETVRFQDEIRDFVSFETKGLDDQVLLKSDGMPTYHLANVVDDHLMDITHVIRGEEWLSSTPKHILLYRYLGWEPPVMAHLPLIMSPSGGKLSKRKAEEEGIPVNTRDYIEQHYEPEAVVNFLAYLGWSPGDDSEIHSLEDLSRIFSLDRVSKGGAVFNHRKLLWYNEHYMREQSDAALAGRIREIAAGLDGINVQDIDDDYLEQVVSLMKDRVSKVDELVTLGRFFFDDPRGYDGKALKKWKKESPELVKTYRDKIEDWDDSRFEPDILKAALQEVIDEKDVGFGKLMMPLRIAVTGMGFGPDLFPAMALLGKETVLRRIDTALERLA